MVGVDDYVHVVMPMFFPSLYSLVQIQPLLAFISDGRNQKAGAFAHPNAF